MSSRFDRVGPFEFDEVQAGETDHAVDRVDWPVGRRAAWLALVRHDRRTFRHAARTGSQKTDPPASVA